MHTSLILTICVLTVHVVKSDDVFTRDNYFPLVKFGGYYKVHTDVTSAVQALQRCRAAGAELFVPRTKDELAAVMELTKVNSVFVGLFDTYATEQVESIDLLPQKTLYLNWAPGFERRTPQSEHCVIATRDLKLKRVSCTIEQPYACRRTLQETSRLWIEAQKYCSSTSMDWVYVKHLDSCYNFNTNHLTWVQAQQACKKMESNLAVVTSEVEATLIKKMILQTGFSDKAFLGFHNLLTTPNRFITIDGEPLSTTGFHHWYEKYISSNRQFGEQIPKCGSLDSDGTLHDISCQQRLPFVCKKKVVNYNQHYTYEEGWNNAIRFLSSLKMNGSNVQTARHQNTPASAPVKSNNSNRLKDVEQLDVKSQDFANKNTEKGRNFGPGGSYSTAMASSQSSSQGSPQNSFAQSYSYSSSG